MLDFTITFIDSKQLKLFGYYFTCRTPANFMKWISYLVKWGILRHFSGVPFSLQMFSFWVNQHIRTKYLIPPIPEGVQLRQTVRHKFLISLAYIQQIWLKYWRNDEISVTCGDTLWNLGYPGRYLMLVSKLTKPYLFIVFSQCLFDNGLCSTIVWQPCLLGYYKL